MVLPRSNATVLWDMADGPMPRGLLGVLELADGRWRRRPAPLIEGIAPRQSVLERLAVTE